MADMPTIVGDYSQGTFTERDLEPFDGIVFDAARIEIAEAKLAVLKGKRESLEKKVSMLHPDSIDRDLLTEQARRVLNYLDQDDFVISGMSATETVKPVGAVQQTIDAMHKNAKLRAISIASNNN